MDQNRIEEKMDRKKAGGKNPDGKNPEWWKEAVVYQIYPKSFMDANRDGVGDIRGIIEKLDYLKWLGVNVLWICPVYCSPMADNGYDISDYYHVDPSFGTDEDLDELIFEAGKRGMKLLMDLVVNHTSDEHPWFLEALEHPDGPYADYYVFREGKDGNPPDNLRSYFGGSVWEQAGETGRYYFHSFGKKQPDLNWENPKLREEIYDMMNYWLDKGLGGFRVDAIGNIKKNLERTSYPADGSDGLSHAGTWILNQPGIEEYLAEMNEKTIKPHNGMTVAEVGVPDELLGNFIGERGFFSMVFDFSYTDIDVPDTAEWFVPTGWTVEDVKKNIFHSQLTTQKVGWGAVYLENHDQPRSVSKYIPEEEIDRHSVTLLGNLFMTLRGTPFIYQGEELGMTNIHMERLEDYDDPATHDQYARALESGVSEKDAWNAVYRRSRDNSRTPMQWSGGKNAGFSEADTTWLKVNPNYREINAEREAGEADSVLAYYRELIRLRTESEYRDIMIHGSFRPYGEAIENVIAYERESGAGRLLIINNFGKEKRRVPLGGKQYEMVLGNYEDIREGSAWNEEYDCRPYECAVLLEKS